MNAVRIRMTVEELILKGIGYLIAPILGLFAFIGKRLHTRLDYLEQKVNQLDKTHAVQQAQLADLKEDIESIDKKLDKILDKLTNA